MRDKSPCYFHFCLRKMYSTFLYVKWRWRHQELMIPRSKKVERDLCAHEMSAMCMSQLMLLIKSIGSGLINRHKVHDHLILFICMSLLCIKYMMETSIACAKWDLKNKDQYLPNIVQTNIRLKMVNKIYHDPLSSKMIVT